jgi:cytochrome c-type biogenesis protein CcmE
VFFWHLACHRKVLEYFPMGESVTHRVLKSAIASVILGAGVTYLVFAGMKSGGVDRYVNDVAQHGKRIRLCGTVTEEVFQVQNAQLAANFYLRGRDKKLRVRYRGVIPDLFKTDVVIEGREHASGVFEGDVLMTKWASKYEEMAKGDTMADTQPTTAVVAKGDRSGGNMGVRP